MPQLAKIPPSQQLQPIDLVAPGFRGLNLVQSGSILSPQYATEATNAIIDANGRLAARDGITNLTSTPISPAVDVKTLFEHYEADGGVRTIIAYDGGISTSVTDPEGSDISGAVTDTNGHWKFVNFLDKVIGFQAGQKLIVSTTGNFATVVESSGTAPNGGIGLAAYGRIWQTQTDGFTIKFSGILSETDWGSASAGSIDMRNIWTEGTDTITAIAAFNGALVVFGQNHVVFWVDGQGSALGIDPTQMYVTDVIAGIGCVTQDTVQAVGETDLLFLSKNGVQSLRRLIQERSAPVFNLSRYVRDEMLTELAAEDLDDVRSVYSPFFGFYLLSFPTAGTVWCFDQRRRYADQDGHEVSIVTRWPLVLTALAAKRNNTVLMAHTTGKIGQYLGDTDEGETYRFVYKSPWLDLGEDLANRLKILKRLGAILFVGNETIVTFKWGVDFRTDEDSLQRTVPGEQGAEWGLGEWGLDEWSGGLGLRILKLPARGRGQYYRIGIEADVEGEFAVQQAELFTIIGRLA